MDVSLGTHTHGRTSRSFLAARDVRAREIVHVPRGTYVGLREPLMPFEARQTTSKATGGRIIRKNELTRRSANKRKAARRSTS